jgi:hypothetical protein
MAILQQRAAAGATWLDRMLPGWFRCIDLGALNLADDGCCVIGQLFGSYNAFQRAGFTTGVGAAVIDRGFTTFGGNHHTPKNFRKLTDAWKREIEARLAA